LVPSLLLLGAGVAQAASGWGFEDATVSITTKGAGVGAGSKDKLTVDKPLSKSIALGAADTVKIILTATENGKAKRPHQAFLLLQEQDTGLETPYTFTVKSEGKGRVEFSQKDLPVQFLSTSKPLKATLLIASFGSSKGLESHVFDVDVKIDSNAPPSIYEKPLRYGQLNEIHHIFKSDPKNPPKIISLVFVAAVLATIPILLGAWAYLGANLSHLGKATAAAPVSHALFFGSIVSIEGVFFLYYSTWSLFQMLPVAGAVGLVAFLSGSKALSEVQGRRLAGER